MIQLYDRDAAVVGDVLPLVAALCQARPGPEYAVAAEALHTWSLEGVEGAPETKREVLTARLNSIVAAIEEQRTD
jgi:hypothetical protein